MFTVGERDALRETVLGFAHDDERVAAGAIVGSLAIDGGGDAFSDLDLTFGVADGASVLDVLDDWTRRLTEDLDAVMLVELRRGPITYRVFLLPEMLQLDLSMAPMADFRPAGPRFRLLFGRIAPDDPGTPPVTTGELFIATPAIAADVFGWAAIYAVHAHRCIERQRVWQAEHFIGAVRDHALSLACMREGVPAVQGRGSDDLSHGSLVRFEDTHIGGLDPDDLRRALRAAVRALIAEGEDAELPDVGGVRDRIAELRA